MQLTVLRSLHKRQHFQIEVVLRLEKIIGLISLILDSVSLCVCQMKVWKYLKVILWNVKNAYRLRTCWQLLVRLKNDLFFRKPQKLYSVIRVEICHSGIWIEGIPLRERDNLLKGKQRYRKAYVGYGACNALCPWQTYLSRSHTNICTTQQGINVAKIILKSRRHKIYVWKK